jgi:hypothetical protein
MTQFPYPLVSDGKEYNLRLKAETDQILSNLLAVLPSFYHAETPSSNYAVELRGVAVELARIKLSLDQINGDGYFATTRSEFLYQTIAYLVFLGKFPKTSFNDIEFKDFLLAIIGIYFKGSIPTALEEGIGLLTTANVKIIENYLLTGTGGYDISDQFTFDVVFEIDGNAFPPDFINLDYNIKLLLSIIKPAHTLYRIKYVFKDTYDASQITDTYTWDMQEYRYEDVRRNWNGIKGVERLGTKEAMPVLFEEVKQF